MDIEFGGIVIVVTRVPLTIRAQSKRECWREYASEIMMSTGMYVVYMN